MQSVIGAANILKCSWPPASGIADAPIFDVPRSNAGFLQRGAQMASIREVVFYPPIAAMNEEYNRMRAFSRGYADVNKLVRVLAVRQPQISGRRFFVQNIFTRHAEQYRTTYVAIVP